MVIEFLNPSTTDGIRPKRQFYDHLHDRENDWDDEGSGIEPIKTYRIAFLVQEFWQPKYLDRESDEFKKLSEQIESALLSLPDYNSIQKIDILEISQTDDSFKLYVTLDVQLRGDEDRIDEFKEELETSLSNFVLGSLSVDGKHFSFKELPENYDSEIQLRRVRNVNTDGPIEFIDIIKCTEPGLFKCKKDAFCILQSEVCDSTEHCLDGSDEENCTVEETDYDSTTPFFTAGTPSGDGEIVHYGEPSYDHIMPHSVPDYMPPITSGSSRCDEVYVCKTSGIEICDIQRCDGHPDCPNHEDEMDCHVCSEDEFKCDYDLCLPVSVRCNGNYDCSDHTDEENCTQD